MLNGSPHQYGCTYTALKEVADTLNANGVETEFFWIGNKPIRGCIGCDSCMTTGRCAFDDVVNELHRKMEEFQGLVIGSPVYMAGINGTLKCLLDRLFMSSIYDFRGKAAAAVVSGRRGGISTAFDCLNKYFMITSMQIVGSQYWNQVHGYTPEDVRKDEEGIQTMRTLGKNMAWLLHSIAAGESAGVSKPSYEEQIYTDFIR